MSAYPTTAKWLAERGGRASFAEFMEAALYHPELGYYTRNISGVGRQGDFSTSATLDPILGRAVAGWLQSQWAERGPLPVIEIGAGDGSLAAAIFSALPWWRRGRLKYHVVDVSPPLISRQKERLRKKNVRWHGTVSAALQAVGGRTLIFSNELADAFPCRLLQKSPTGWEEIFLTLNGSQVREEGRELLADSWSGWSACAPARDWKTGQRVEVLESYRQWQAEWLPHWQEGALLTIDYGALLPQLYDRRTGGTLRAYFSHHRLEGPDLYARFGRQDLTVDVNFTDLIQWGEVQGLKSSGAWSQREFLQKHAARAVEKRGQSAELAFLLDPQGAGEAFRVLEQSR